MLGNQSGQKEIDVNIQSQTSPLFQYFLMEEQKDDIALTIDAVKDSEILSVSSGHGFTAVDGERIVIWENNQYIQLVVTAVDGNDISIEVPLAMPFSFENAKVLRGNVNMNVDGSSTPVDFQIRIQDYIIPIDVSKIILTMFHTSAGDDGKFSGIAELTKGLYFRKDGPLSFNLGNYKNNQSFKNVGGEVAYTSKGPAGIEATDIVFDLEKIFGQVIRLDARVNDLLRGVVRDPLDGMSSFTTSIIGSYTSGE